VWYFNYELITMNEQKFKSIKQSTSCFLEESFNFWFKDHKHIRCPFPENLQEIIKENTTKIFVESITEMDKKESEVMNDTYLVEMFETILFNEAYKIAENDDQKLTFTYPFLPRLGDKVDHITHGEGKIISRKEIVGKENKKFFQLSISSYISEQIWNTEFELPA
jgi:hypothetical protein